MDTVSEMASALFEDDTDLYDDDSVIAVLRQAGFKDNIIKVFLDEAIEIAIGMHHDAEQVSEEEGV